MDAKDAIRKMCKAAKKSQRAVSLEIGKSPTFIGTTLYKNSAPCVDTMSAIADACGFELVLVGHGEQYVLYGEDDRTG